MESKLKRIFNHYGFHNQENKFKEEVLEFGAAAQAYLNEPSKEHLRELKEEISDLIVVDKQFALTHNREKLFNKMEVFYRDIVIHYEGLIKSIFRENRKEIEIIMDRKIERTLVRIAASKGNWN